VQNRPQTGSQPVPATYIVHITVHINNFYEYNNEKEKRKPLRAEALSRLGLATPRSSPPPIIVHHPPHLSSLIVPAPLVVVRRPPPSWRLVVGGCVPVVVVCRPPVVAVQHPPSASFVGSLRSSLLVPHHCRPCLLASTVVRCHRISTPRAAAREAGVVGSLLHSYKLSLNLHKDVSSKENNEKT
jgi:hypothetical protein